MSKQTTQQIKKIIVISDTHGYHNLLKIQKCDILIHCGDFTQKGEEKEVRSFGKWLNKQNSTHKIIVLGNHERELRIKLPQSIEWLTSECKGVELLINRSIEIDNLIFYGSICRFEIPEEVEMKDDKQLVLICHEPPHKIMDEMVINHWKLKWDTFEGGNYGVNMFVDKFKPKLVLFGHCHNCYGIQKIEDTIYVNASYVSEIGLPWKSPISLVFDGDNFIY